MIVPSIVVVPLLLGNFSLGLLPIFVASAVTGGDSGARANRAPSRRRPER